VGLSELEMMIAVGGSSVCAGGTAISSSNYPGTTAANLFDGSTATSSYWANQTSGSIYGQ
jgi:alcohol dehydrogenase YqhD (iron-dependent ADH family)